MTSSALWSAIQRHRANHQLQTLAVMGLSKNTGKTVTLNHLLAEADAAHVAVGVTSIGRDGEERDQVFAIPKPPVRVRAGNLVATARDTLLRAGVRFKLLGGTGIDSPMGEIVLVRTLDDGEMEVAGASRSHDQLKAIALLKQCGAALVILDGALGRSHHASPALADGVILATGAAVNGGGGGIADVIRKTRERLAILGIPAADEATAARVRGVFANGGVGVWDTAGRPLFNSPMPTLSAGPVLLDLFAPEMSTIAVSGAVGRALWQAFGKLLDDHPGLGVVVADGTRLFVEHADLQAFQRRGGRLFAYRGIRIAGITLNPFSPFGGSFAADEFLAAARGAFDRHVVSDVQLEGQSVLQGAC